MKKRIISLLLIGVLSIALLVGCKTDEGQNETNNVETQETSNDETQDTNEGESQDTSKGENQEPIKIKVAATPTPHAEILEVVQEVLATQGYELEIVEFMEYVQPNNVVASGEIDANYFQHQPHLDDFNENNDNALATVDIIHYEPFGIYSEKINSLEELEDGGSVAVPNDTSNEARALLLLEAQGLIELDENAGLLATINDIVSNPKNLEIVELEAAQIPRILQDVDIAVINGNFAIDAGLKVGEDAIAIEDKESISAATYGNIVAVKSGNEENEGIKALVKALKSDEVKQFIEDTYEGAVVPMF